jgi:hypothetical protein
MLGAKNTRALLRIFIIRKTIASVLRNSLLNTNIVAFSFASSCGIYTDVTVSFSVSNFHFHEFSSIAISFHFN